MTVEQNEVNEKKSIIETIKNGWVSLPKSRKIILSIIVGIVILGLVVYGLFFSQKDYTVLYSNLDIETAGEVKSALEENGVTDYKIGEGGSSILVPKSQVDSIRMDLAVNGVTPTKGSGYELFDSSKIGLTEQERQIMYQRALEGELRRSIISLEMVEDARVHLNLTEESVFNRETEPSSASVVVSLKKNGKLNEAQVQGIVALISGAVHNLSDDNIQIVDTEGNLLSRSVNNDSYQTEVIINQEVDYEVRLEEKIKAQLGKVLGYEKLAVSVRVNLDKTSQEERIEEYSNGALISEQSQFNRFQNYETEENSGGPLDNNMQNLIEEGAENNVANNALQDSSIANFEERNNYQPSVTESHTIKPPGEVKSISVSVIYSGELEESLSNLINEHVASIVGIDPERGDKVSVAGIPFELPDINADGGATIPEQILNNESYMLYAIIGAIGFILLLMIFKKSSKKRKQQAYEEEIERLAVYKNPSMSADNEGDEGTADEFSDALLKQVKELFKSNRTTTHELLKIWMNEGKTGVTSDTSSSQTSLSGIDKAASLLIVLGKEITSETIKDFSHDEVARIAQVISGIRVVPRQMATMLLSEFLKMYDAHKYLSQGGYEFAKETLTRAMGEEDAEDVLRKLKGAVQIKRPFDAIRRVDATQLFNLLINEHPQTIALVLCYLPTEKASKIIAELPEELQAEVTQRIGQMNQTSSHIVDAVERAIESRLQSLETGDMTQIGGLNTVVNILNSVDRTTQKNILKHMHESNASFATEVQNNLFVFDDIVQLDDMAIQRVIRDIDQATLALSLKGASDTLMKAITKNMSARAAERLKEELEYLGPVRLADVEKAQLQVVETIRRLEDSGEIVLSHGGEDDVVY
ncbi:flagellar motor switch protein FliG [Turicibacter sanguinis]|uniref:flagellar motor switch protein FliG n=1 Tax=Turicibacter sanguinis TaxID=154288 RepID=UPI0018AB4225|nr:flagellar motor switch protein FliG [Turicibacter sanguinis]MDB8551146.1 flagellar motor switch protein FliG [Turicibacter sanguinis]